MTARATDCCSCRRAARSRRSRLRFVAEVPSRAAIASRRPPFKWASQVTGQHKPRAQTPYISMCTRSSSRCLSPPARSCSALYRTLRHVALVVVLPRLCVSGFEDQADRSETCLVRSCRVASNNGLLEEIEDFTMQQSQERVLNK